MITTVKSKTKIRESVVNFQFNSDDGYLSFRYCDSRMDAYLSKRDNPAPEYIFTGRIETPHHFIVAVELVKSLKMRNKVDYEFRLGGGMRLHTSEIEMLYLISTV